MAIALIQGASRGIGLEYARILSSRGVNVIGTCRDPSKADNLRALPNTEVIRCDVTQENDIINLADTIQKNYKKLDLVVNSSAILHPSGRGETRLKDVDFNGLMSTLATNTTGPLVVAKHTAPLLQKGSGIIGSSKYKDNNKKCHSGVLVNMTAKVGSISDNGLGGWYSYRLSKCALNMATKNLSIELGRGKNRIVCLSLHPGTTDTELSRPYHKNVPADKLFSPNFAVSKLLEIIDNATIDDTGKYIAWDGTEIPF
eukprot:TRINITY_DN35360_c0_g1_i13.p1 TRINITY_DN35360_c0_g1~~TRINITY_DN35360_c0_g1_i13.p1  ORF type:complete len:257 (-),score=23.55 TRINITY_DN35360_c0_g1_i13:486-1256(-)